MRRCTTRRVHQCSDPEISEFGDAGQGKEYVLRFDVPVQQAPLMAQVESPQRSPHPVQCLCLLDPIGFAASVERTCSECRVEVWHVNCYIGVVDLKDMFALQRCKQTGFVPGGAPVASENQLQSHFITAMDVKCAPDFTEATTANHI